LVMCSINY